jgi:hypothetical protein
MRTMLSSSSILYKLATVLLLVVVQLARLGLRCSCYAMEVLSENCAIVL